MSCTNDSSKLNRCRKWFGVICFVIEMNLMTSNIFGFAALFEILPKYGIYQEYCQVTTNPNSTIDCSGQTQQYQNALTLGIILFNLPSIFVGISIDKLGCRFTKLIGVIFHLIGWLSLAFIQSDKRSSLLYVHTAFISLSGIIVQLTGYASCNYFTKARVLLMTLFTGASASASIWYSIFQILIDNNLSTLYQLSCIWSAFSIIIFVSSFVFLDWTFPILNLPYQFDTRFEQDQTPLTQNDEEDLKWYKAIWKRQRIWKHLTNPVYILVVLFLSFLMLPNSFLSVVWYPWVYYINNNDKTITDQYTLGFNLASLSMILLSPIFGLISGFRLYRGKEQQILNSLIVQTITWFIVIIGCILPMFPYLNFIIPSLIFCYLGRAAVICGSQAVIFTFFPSKYCGSLIGLMWTVAGSITSIQYGLIKLTTDVSQSWKAWIIILAFVICMFSHVIQLFIIYLKQLNKNTNQIDSTK